jgi:predicted dehydrogenase
LSQHHQSPSDRLRVAFLGGAYNSAVGRVHRVAVEMDQRFELVGGCFSRHPDANRDSAIQYGLDPARLSASLDELLDRQAGKIDALVVLTPTNQHETQVLRCLGAGLPVICEKALATSSAEALAIQRQLADHGGFLAVTYNYTGYPMLRELRQMVADGRFGKIEQIHVEMPQDGFARFSGDGSPLVPQDWRLRDGRVPTISLDLGVHLHMMVRFLTDETPVEVVATSNTYGNFGQVVDNVSCLARYTNNLHCNIWYSKTALGYRNGLKLRLFGEQGAAEWVQENPEYLTLTDHYGTKSIVDRASRDIKVANQGRYARFKVGHPAGFVEAFANYYCDTADALAAHLAGQPATGEYVFGIEDALQGLRVLEAIADSSANRCWATVESGT